MVKCAERKEQGKILLLIEIWARDKSRLQLKHKELTLFQNRQKWNQKHTIAEGRNIGFLISDLINTFTDFDNYWNKVWNKCFPIT